MPFSSFAELIDVLKGTTATRRVAVACACDQHTLEAVFRAERDGICRPVLVGDRAGILSLLDNLGHSASDVEILDEPDEEKACRLAAHLVREERADFLLKGNVDTTVYLRAVVDKGSGLGKGGLMSHFALFEAPSYHKLIAPVDGGMVAYPTLDQKRQIIQNTVDTLRAMGYAKPKVGVLACVEKVNPKMPETVEAAELKRMCAEGKISNCVVEGPISYDCAMSKEIALLKGFESEVAGDADALLAPNIHAGNIMGKMLSVSCGAKMAGFIVGAVCPVIMTSRGSSAEEKYLSLAIAAAAAE